MLSTITDSIVFFLFFFSSIADKRYISTLPDARAAINDRSYQALTTRVRTIDKIYYNSDQ